MPEVKRSMQQFERVQRWYERFQAINDGRPHEQNNLYYDDEVLAFFVFCHHLSEWIKKDETLSDNVGSKAEKLVQESRHLQVCRHLANGIKHLRRLPDRPDVQIKGKKIVVCVGESSTISQKYRVDFDGETIDAFELATKCLATWRKFVNEKIAPQAENTV